MIINQLSCWNCINLAIMSQRLICVWCGKDYLMTLNIKKNNLLKLHLGCIFFHHPHIPHNISRQNRLKLLLITSLIFMLVEFSLNNKLISLSNTKTMFLTFENSYSMENLKGLQGYYNHYLQLLVLVPNNLLKH